MSGGESDGRRGVVFLGESKAEYQDGATEGTDETLVKPATMEEAVHDLGVQARRGGFETVRIVSIEITTGNPHIKEVSLLGAPLNP